MVFCKFLQRTRRRTSRIVSPITNESGRLSKDEVERMVMEAEKYAEDDKKHSECVHSKNDLESLLHSSKQRMDDEKIKIETGDREKIRTKCADIKTWIDGNPNAEKLDFEEKNKELEDMMTNLSLEHESPGAEKENTNNEGARVEEVD